MKKLLILSGKGGTGKTTAAAAFIRFSDAQAAADCDVDAPNLHLVSGLCAEPERSVFLGADKAFVRSGCTGCGECERHCRFGAVKKGADGKYHVTDYLCEGCGVCALVCPVNAVEMRRDEAGRRELYRGERVFSTAELKMGRGNSGKLVTEVKRAMENAAGDAGLAIIDGSPGIGCPVIASVSGTDLVLIVTEPTVSGLSDLERILKTADILQAKAAVCVNKYDTDVEKTEEIERYCVKKGVPFLGKVPYDKRASDAVNSGKSIAQYDCPARDALYEIYKKAVKALYEEDKTNE